MRFYLCSGTSQAALMQDVAKRLDGLGHEVVSRWHADPRPRLELDDPALLARALMDLDDLDRANVVVAFAGGRS